MLDAAHLPDDIAALNAMLLTSEARVAHLLDGLERWLHTMLATLSRKSDTTAAILYARKLWPALTRYADNGRIEIDNSAAERALRGVALGRRNFLFAGADSGGDVRFDWYCQAQWRRPRGLAAARAGTHRRTSRQTGARLPALEPG